MYTALSRTTANLSGTPSGAAVRRVPIVPTLLVIAVFIPQALGGFYVFDLSLNASRVVLFVAAPIVLFQPRSSVGSRDYPKPMSDFLVPLACTWMILALAEVDGGATALKSGGIDALEFLMPYATMRYLLRDEEQLHAVVKVFCIAAAVAGLLGLLDTFNHSFVLREGLARLTGYQFRTIAGLNPHPDLTQNYRLGLYRATGVFQVPELFGTTMFTALLLCSDLEGRTRRFCILGAGVGLFISLSSGPWMAMVLGLGLFLYRRKVRFSGRWLTLIVAGTMALVIFVAVKEDPFSSIVYHFTLDPQTGYFRLLIWRYAGANVMQSPIFGLGLAADWTRPDWMPSSVDSLWLALAMQFGIPGSILIGVAVIAASSRSSWNAGGIGAREIKLAETLGIITFLTVFNGFTVHYYGVNGLILSFLAGMRAFLGQLGPRH
jgi:O-antigen ligase